MSQQIIICLIIFFPTNSNQLMQASMFIDVILDYELEKVAIVD